MSLDHKKDGTTRVECVVILDAGSQYGKVIDRKVRELRVETRILPLNTPTAVLRDDPAIKAVIISGGPNSIHDVDAPAYNSDLFELGKPLLGICYGMQLLARFFDGRVGQAEVREDGQDEVSVDTTSPLFNGLTTTEKVLLTHGDSIIDPGVHLKVTARSSAGIIAALQHKELPLFGVQFHPEVDLTEKGVHILKNFLTLSGCQFSYTIEDREELALRMIRERTAGGFAQASTEMPAKRGREAYRTGKLCEVTEPEEKRVIIGNTFMSVCDAVMKEMNLDVNNLLLAQGTLRPDLIESGSVYASKVADAIKTHHNDTGIVRQLREKGRIIEPLCDYHKDEVRVLGERLGIPHHLVNRQPFPGPGLAIRTLCSNGELQKGDDYEMTEQIVQQVCAGTLSNDVMKPLSELLRTLRPAPCLLPVRTVGVQGDARTYAYAVALSIGHFPQKEEWEQLGRLALAIPKVSQHINRVVFMFGERRTAAPQSVTRTTLTLPVLEKLRTADNIVNSVLLKHNLVRRLSQVPVVLLPLSFEEKGSLSIVIRTFITNDFMTGVPALPGSPIMPLDALKEMLEALEALDFVSRVMYDLTAKPPGTTEWE
uniref:GMP synthase (glutamine-hydrolyzing) n=1 Tax=Trypanosoma vivax (strain Y486) TaxID=1055687 RepID=G0TY00_TRYVY|nr:putative GMP synthase, fragment [Trypanosoma vivax Y486]